MGMDDEAISQIESAMRARDDIDSDDDDHFAGLFAREYFHDRKQTYIRPTVTDEVDEDDWEELDQLHPTLLQDDEIPVDERSTIVEHCDDSNYTFLPGRPRDFELLRLTMDTWTRDKSKSVGAIKMTRYKPGTGTKYKAGITAEQYTNLPRIKRWRNLIRIKAHPHLARYTPRFLFSDAINWEQMTQPTSRIH